MPCMTTCYHLYKKRVLKGFFYVLERFLFSSGYTFHPTKPAKIILNLLNSCIQRLLSRDVNKDLTPKDQDKDKDLTPKDQDKDKDLTPKDQDKDKDLTPKDQDKDKDLKYVLK